MSALPSHIGAYEVVRLLGKGGMAIVYLGRDPAIDRLVAIKLLRESLDSVELRERFSREAKSAGRLRHPNIVTVFQVGVHDHAPFIVMEYIPGESLADVIRRQPPLTVTWKLRVMEDLCRGLAYAHKSGVVHRDMKPANIQIDSDGGVKILDFGIARLGEQKAGEEALTRLGMMMGTPNYMAPEQINPGTADHRSDVFAVGLVFYELLTYHRAFGGDSYAVLHNILHQQPDPVERHCPGIDPDIIAIVNRALDKDPAARYQDLGDMRDDIRRIRLRLRAASDDMSDEGPITGGGHSVSETDVTRVTDRKTEINRFLDEARTAYEASDFEKAVERCEQALKLDPTFTAALELSTRASDQIALAKARDLIAAGQEAYATGNLEAAASHIRNLEALKLPREGGSTVQSQLSALARAVASATERQKVLRERLERARDLLAAGALDNAASVVDEALGLSPGNRDAQALRTEVRAAIDAERARLRAAEDAVAEARQQADNGRFESAMALLQDHLPQHPLVTAALGEIQALKAEADQRAAAELRRQEHAAAARSTLVAARRAAEQGDLADALQRIESITFDDPTLASAALDRVKTEADALVARCEAGQHLHAARAALAVDDLTAAAANLDKARRRDPDHPDHAGVALAIDRARTVRDRIARARAGMESGDLNSAERLVAEALTLWSDHPEALQLRDTVRSAIAEREAALQRAADEAIATARREAKRGEFAKAIAGLKKHRPTHPQVTAALSEIVEQQAAAERRVADERRRQEHASRAGAAIRAARAAADQGDPSAALMLLQGIEFDRAEIRSPALDALKTEADALIARCEAAGYLDQARAALAENDLTAAATSLEHARHRDPSHPDHAGVATAIDRARTIRDRIGRARAEMESGDLNSAERLVAEALTLWSDHPEALRLRDTVRAAIAEREAALQRAADEAIATARREAKRGEFAKAIAGLKKHRPTHPQVTAALSEIVEQQAAAERRAADERRRQKHASGVAAAISAARAAADQGDPSAALMLLQGIAFEGAEISSPALDALKTEADALIARCEAAGYLHQARAALAANDLTAAATSLEHARHRDPSHPDHAGVATAIDRAKTIRDRIGRARAEMESGDLNGAERLVAEALTLWSDHPEALQLRDRLRAAIAEREAALQRAADPGAERKESDAFLAFALFFVFVRAS